MVFTLILSIYHMVSAMRDIKTYISARDKIQIDEETPLLSEN